MLGFRISAFLAALLTVTVVPQAYSSQDQNRSEIVRQSDERRSKPSTRNAYKLTVRAETRCGWPHTKLRDTLERDIVEISRLNISFLPILLTNKRKESVLNHKIRTPCIEKQDNGKLYKIISEDEIQVKVATSDSFQNSAKINISMDGKAFRVLNNNPHFYIILDQYGTDAFMRKNRIAQLVRGIKNYDCEDKSFQKCSEEYEYFVERHASQEMRRQIAGVRLDSFREHHREIDRALIGAPKMVNALHRVIVPNESSVISPFQVWDAIHSNSGISFGAKQWDYGTGNKQAVDILKTLAGNGQTGLDLKRTKKAIRKFSIQDLQNWSNNTELLNEKFTSKEGRELLKSRYINWIKTSPFETAKKFGIDLKTPIGRATLLYYLDISNQHGPNSKVVKQVLAAAKEASVVSEFRQSVERYVLATRYGINYPTSAKRRLERTWNVIESVL